MKQNPQAEINYRRTRAILSEELSYHVTDTHRADNHRAKRKARTKLAKASRKANRK